MSYIFMLVVGFGLLIGGGELLVRGAVTIAERLGMSPLLIGLVLVSFATSTPELVTSVEAALAGSPGIAVGNIVGSNISNILLVLGVSAIIAPITVSSKAFSRDGVLVFIAAILFTAIGFLFSLDRVIGIALMTCLLSYLYYAYRQETAPNRLEHSAAFEKVEAFEALHERPVVPNKDKANESSKELGILSPVMLTIVGLIILIAGGKLLVDSAIGLAHLAGISETIIGLTIVAIGTSLPELVTSVIAALRKHGDVALGNILGSCLYNILGVGGMTAILSPTIIPQEIARFDNLVMVAASGLLLLFALTGSRIGRWHGAALLASYCTYLFVIWP